MQLTPTQELVINTVIPISVLVIMFSMGLSLRLSDFKRVLTVPKSFLVAMGGQYLFVPALAVLLISLLDVPPAIALGAIIVAAIPGGIVSNGFVYVGRGNAALSVSLTAVSQFIGMVTIPLYISWGISAYYSDVPDVEFPVVQSVAVVLVLNLVPMGLGMLFLRRFANTAQRIEPLMRRLSLVLLFAVVVVAIWPNFAIAKQQAGSAGLLAVLVCVLGVLFGNVVSRAVGLDRRDAFTNGIEIGIQNLSTAILIAVTILGRSELAVYIAVYSVVSPIVMTLSALVFNFGRKREAAVTT